MPFLPLSPRLNGYRGAKPTLQRKAAEENRIAHLVCEHVNRLIANNPEEMQQYLYAYIALDLGLPAEIVKRSIPGGGSNGITLRVEATDRAALERFKDRI